MCYFGLRTTEEFEKLKIEIARLKCHMEELYNSNIKTDEDGIHTRLRSDKNVCDCDPAIVKTEGDNGNTSNSKAKVRWCINCKDVGHTRHTCPSIHNQQAEHVDGDNQDEFMEHHISNAPVSSPNLQTPYFGDLFKYSVDEIPNDMLSTSQHWQGNQIQILYYL